MSSFPFMPVMAIPKVKPYVGGVTTLAPGTSTVTTSSLDIGPASGNRLVVAMIHARDASNRTLNSVTIGGVSATLYGLGGSTTFPTATATAVVPSGTTAVVVVNFSGTVAAFGCQVFSLYSLQSNTPVSVVRNAVTGATSVTETNWVTPANGVSLFSHFHNNSNAVTCTGFLELQDLQVATTGNRFATGIDDRTGLASNTTNRTVSWVTSGGGNLLSASFV